MDESVQRFAGTLPCGYLVTDENDNIIFANKFILNALAYDKRELTGPKHLFDIFPVGSKLFFESNIRPLLMLKRSAEEVSIDLVRADQTRVAVLMNALVDRDEKSGTDMFHYSFFDISHRKKHEAELLKKQKELQALTDLTAEQNKRLVNFTYVISHNIRSQINNIIGILDLTDDEEEDIRNAQHFIKISVKNLDETIKNLNQIISIQENINLPVKSFYVRHEIDKIIVSINTLVSYSSAEIYCDFDEDEQLTTNPAYFESIILNLLTNAIKYKSPDRPPEIHISLEERDNYQVIVFKDNGSGIDLTRHKDKIFGLYNTFHGNKEAKGLGLFITKTQIEAMGGKIEVDSTKDVGTTFRVFFKKKTEVLV